MKTWLFKVSILLLVLTGCRADAQTSGGGGATPDAIEIAAAPTGVAGTPTPVRLPLVFNPARPLASPTSPSANPPAPVPPPASAPQFSLCSPLADTPIADLPQIVSEPYNPPPPGREERHHGVDFAYYHRYERESIGGATIQAIMAGQVAAAVTDRFPYGNVVILETPANRLPGELAERIHIASDQSLYLLFAHLHDPPLVALGDEVDACQTIGNAGRSGNAGAAHLHVEARIGPQAARFESLAYYVANASDKERENYLLWRTSGIFQHFDPMAIFNLVAP